MKKTAKKVVVKKSIIKPSVKKDSLTGTFIKKIIKDKSTNDAFTRLAKK